MSEPAGDRTAAGDHSNGAGSAEWKELRRLMIGQELDQLGAIQERLDDPARRAKDIAQVLPDAVKGARGKALREALEPVFEKSFQSSVRKHPKELSEAIYPVMGPAIRKSIRAAIREFAETLNQIVEKSASLRAIRWRLEARFTGKSFSEILLARSLLYSVEQVFLIHRKSGLLLQHVEAKGSVLKDADMIAGMFTAIQDFFNDSFTEGGQDLETVDAGRFRLWIQYGPKAILAAAVSGSAPVELKNVLRNAIDQIHENLYAELDTFKQDDLSPFDAARPIMEACLLGNPEAAKKRSVLPWIAAGVILAGLVSFVAYRVREAGQWERYFSSLRQQPGIAVTGISRQGSMYVVTGLKDPKAPDPAVLAQNHGRDARQVRYEWQPYLSLNTPFAAEREADAAREAIEREVVRFENGSSRLPLSEAEHLESIAAAAKQLKAGARIILSGHTDEVGSEETNLKLSQDRANKVLDALLAQGVPKERVEAVGVGNSHPVRQGASEWDRATNRSVSFQISLR